MAVLEPDLTSIPLAPVAGSTQPALTPAPVVAEPATSGPIVPNLPSARTAFVNKYREIAPFLREFDVPVRRTIFEMDVQRVSRGQQPLTRRQTALALLAAQQQRAITKPPEKKATNVLGNALDDIKSITQAVPRLPVSLLREVVSIPNFAEELQELRDQGLNPIAALAQAPGVRLLPGAFIVGQAAQGPEGIRTLVEHPVFTALDALPFASKAAAATKVGKLAQAEGMNPIRAVLTRKPLPEGQLPSPISDSALVPNRLGRVTQRIAQSRPGRALQEAFGSQAREAASLEQRAGQQVADWMNPEGTPTNDPDIALARRAHSLYLGRAESEFGVSPQRSVELNRIAQLDPELIPRLPDNEQAYLAEVRDINTQFARTLTDKKILGEFGGEFYDRPTYDRLARIRRLHEQRFAKIHNEVLPRLNELIQQGADERVVNLRNLVADAAEGTGSWADATKALNGLLRGKTRLGSTSHVGKGGDPSNVMLASIANMRDTIRKAAAIDKLHARAVERAAPARFMPLIGQRANKLAAREFALRIGDPSQEQAILDALVEGHYGSIPEFDQNILDAIREDVKKTWLDMKREGLDPIFVHRAPPNAEFAINYPKVWHQISRMSQVKERTLEPAPAIGDINVSLSHQAMELMSRRVSEQLTDDIINSWGVREIDLVDHYLPEAQLLAQRKPHLDVRGHLQELIRRDYVPYSAEQGFWKTVRAIGRNDEGIWLPKTVANTFDRLARPTESLGAILDPAMAAFRTSVLPLSPRWHVYNILGNIVQTLARTGPSVFKYFTQARRMLNGDEALPSELRYSLGQVGKDVVEYNYYAGKTLRRLFDQIQESKQALTPAVSAAERLGNLGSKLVRKSFDLNAWFDDTARVMTYLYGKGKALGKGASDEAAVKAGLQLTRKVMQDWTALTPIERSIIRRIFPFYGFMSHILRYAMQYPFDHPIRASIISAFARAELEDLGDGLGRDFLNAFTFGEPDENGNVKQISLTGLNPFRDVADLFTLQGFIGQVNPVLSTALQSLGIDTMSGGPELYPNLHYDSQTGRLKADTGNPLLNLVQNTIPQTRLLGNLLGINREFKRLASEDPDAAQRLIRSQLGLPVMFRTINISEEYARAELNRDEMRRDAINQALKTGDDSEARRWPGASALLDAIREKQAAGELSAFIPEQVPGQSPSQLLTGALRNTLPFPIYSTPRISSS